MMTRTFQKLKVISLVALAATPEFAQQSGRPELTNLVLELKVDKTDYLPGELIELRFRLAARSGAALAPTRISVTAGSLGILVSQGSGAYLEYQGPEWGTKKTSLPGVVALSGDQAIEATATLLYNGAPATAHLSPIYAQQLLEGRMP